MASSVGPVQVKLELGHRATARRRPTPEGFTHDWCVSVRGPDGAAINHFVEKVVFHLHESFAKPKRVCREPPYKVEESGYAGFILPIEVYFKNKEEPRKVKFDYDLFLHLEGQPPVNHLRCEKLTFSNPPSDFRRRLLKAGGMMVSPDGMAVLSAPPEVPSSSSHPEHRKPPASLHVKDFSKPIASLKPPKPFKGHKEKPSESKDYKAPAPGDGPSRESAKKAAARAHKPRDEPKPPPPATPPPKAPSKEPKALSKRDRSDAGDAAEPAPVAAESREPKPPPASKRSRASLDERADAKRAKKLPSDAAPSRQWAPVSSSSSSSSSSTSSSSSSSSASSASVVTVTASAAAVATEKVAAPKERPSKGGDVDGGTRAKGKTTAPAAAAAAPVALAAPAAVAPVPAEERARDKTWRKKHDDELRPATKPHGKSHGGRLRDKTAPAADREPPAERTSKAKDKLNSAAASVAAAAAAAAAAPPERQQPDRGAPKDRDAPGRAEAAQGSKAHRKAADKAVPVLSPLGDALDPGDSDDELSLATDERPASVASGASSISHGAAPEPAQSELSVPEPLSVSPSEDEQEPPSAPKSSRSSELSDSEHSSDASPAPPVLRHANKAYMEELVRLHRRLMMLRERSTLQQVVNLIEETGHFQVTSTTFDFDLFSLDQAIVRKLQSYLGPTEAV